jgi:hypothetical protein
MKQLPNYEKIVEEIESKEPNISEPLLDFIEFDEFIGGTPIGDKNKPIIDRLFKEGYPIGFAAQTPESFTFRVYKKGGKTPPALHLITGISIK